MTPAAHAQGKWRTGTPIPQGANEVIGAKSMGRFLSMAVKILETMLWASFGKLDPAKNEWSKLPSKSGAGTSRRVGEYRPQVLRVRRIPAAGHRKVGWYPENKAWVFDLDTQKWSALPPMPTTRGALAAVAVGKKIYVSGGAGIPQGMHASRRPSRRWPGRPLRTLEVFDIDSNAWSKLAPIADPAQPPQHHLCRWQAVLPSAGGGSCYFGRFKSHDTTSAARLALEKRIREALATPGRPGIRVIAERFGVNPSTVQRISRPFDGASVAVA
jgi:hypothetical protein